MTRNALHLCFYMFLLVGLPSLSTGAEQSPRIFFNKRIPAAQKDLVKKHTVKRGEHLFKILRSYGIPEKELSKAAQTTARINPDIPDLDLLEPGQSLLIPLSSDVVKDDKGKLRVEYQHTPPPTEKEVKKLKYTVKRGDRVANLLRQLAKVPEYLIFDEYLDRFRQMNPHIKDINILEVGQTVFLPMPAGKLAEDLKKTMPKNVSPQVSLPRKKPLKIRTKIEQETVQPKKEKPQASIKKDVPPRKHPSSSVKSKQQEPVKKEDSSFFEKKPRTQVLDRRSFLVSVLSHLGFRFAPGEELLFPLGENKWLKVNLNKTPMGRTPWGERFVLLPNSEKNKELDFLKISYMPVFVPDNWDPKKILSIFEDKSNGQFKVWPPNHPLILNREGIILELNASVLVRVQNRKFFLMNLLDNDDEPTPALLQSYLAKHNITLLEWKKHPHSPPERVIQAWPDQKELNVAWVDRYNAWPEIKLRLGPKGRAVAPDERDIDTVITALGKNEMVERENVRLTWFENQDREISITIPATLVNDGIKKVALVRWEEASPHLMSLLTLKGYPSLAIK